MTGDGWTPTRTITRMTYNSVNQNYPRLIYPFKVKFNRKNIHLTINYKISCFRVRIL